jgi:hypothetical protein
LISIYPAIIATTSRIKAGRTIKNIEEFAKINKEGGTQYGISPKSLQILHPYTLFITK